VRATVLTAVLAVLLAASAMLLREDRPTAIGYLLIGASGISGAGYIAALAEAAMWARLLLTETRPERALAPSVIALGLVPLMRRGRGSHWPAPVAKTACVVYSALALTGGCAALFRPFPLAATLGWSAAFALVALTVGRHPEQRPRWDTKGAALAAASAGLTLLLLEAGARLLPSPPPRDDLFQPHPKAVTQHRPGFDGPVLMVDATGDTRRFPVRINTLGMRGPDVPPKQPGEWRILLLGDSYTFGWGVPFEETIGARLEARLAAQYPEHTVRVLNGGMGGSAPWQMAVLLEERYKDLEPDAVVLQTFATNDVADTLLRDGRVLRAYSHEEERRVRHYRNADTWPYRVDRALRSCSSLYARVDAIAGRRHPLANAIAHLRFVHLSVQAPAFATEPYNWILEVERAEAYADLEDGFRLLFDSIDAIAAACEARAMPLVAYNIPWPFVPDDFTAMRDDSPDHGFAMHHSARRMERYFDSAPFDHIAYLDAVLAHPDPKALTLENDGHLSPAGSAFTAALIAEALRPHLETSHAVPPPER